MADWKSVKLASMLPTELVGAASTVTDVISQFVELQKQALNLAKVYQATLDGGAPDVLGTLVNAVVAIVEKALAAGKIHVLFVPISKQVPTNTASGLPPTLEALMLENGWDLTTAAPPFDEASADAYASLAGKAGGNSGFYNTFLQSLNDALDPSRPQYTGQTDAVSLTVMMMGAPSFSDAANYAATLGRILKPPTNSDLAAGAILVPRDLTAQVLTAPGAPQVAVQLNWQPAPVVFRPPYFPSVAMTVKRYAVIRTASPTAASAATVFDLFNTRDLKEGLTSTDEAKLSKVIAVGSGLNSSYLDTDELDAAAVYYYYVTWEIEIVENNKTSLLTFDRLSNVCKTRVVTPVPVKAVPPDWVSFGSPLDLLPDLKVQVNNMLDQVRTLGERQKEGASGAVSNAINMAIENLDRMSTQLDQLNASFAQLQAIFGSAMPALYTTSFSGTGGNTYLSSELAKRLNDRTDPGRPPFDNNEYVFGVCIVTGAARQTDIQPTVDLIQSVFQPDTSTNTLYDILASLDAIVDTVEQSVFGPDMQAIPVAADGTITLPSGDTLPVADFDNNTGLPRQIPKPVIADDGTAVTADDPRNPEAGQTNEKLITDLC